MAKSVRVLRRELRAAQTKIDDATLLERERSIEAEALRRSIDGRDAHIRQLGSRIDRLSADLGKEQQLSALVSNCLHGILAMTKGA